MYARKVCIPVILSISFFTISTLHNSGQLPLWIDCCSDKTWILKSCDVNKDVKVSSVAQVTLPDFQIPFVDRAFRAYVKPIGDNDSYYRVEWSLAPNKPVKLALETMRNEVKLDGESLIECLSS
jgi:hypothetical protein